LLRLGDALQARLQSEEEERVSWLARAVRMSRNKYPFSS